MKKRQVKAVLRADKPQDVNRIMAAIKSLGKSPTEIAQKLVKMGFEKGDQTDPRKCPVCLYLKSLGLKSPYVDAVGFGAGAEEHIVHEWAKPMAKFQQLAGSGDIVCLGGYREYEDERL